MTHSKYEKWTVYILLLLSQLLSLFLSFLSFSSKEMSQLSPQLFDKIKYFAKFPQTGVSLRQMVMFGNYPCVSLKAQNTDIRSNITGQKPSQGTLFKASQFLHGKWSMCVWVGLVARCAYMTCHRGTAYSTRPSCQGAGGAASQFEQNAIHHQGQELVRQVVPGPCRVAATTNIQRHARTAHCQKRREQPTTQRAQSIACSHHQANLQFITSISSYWSQVHTHILSLHVVNVLDFFFFCTHPTSTY